MITLRWATPDDAEAWVALHDQCWDDAYTGLVPQHLIDARRVDRPTRIVERRAWLESGLRVRLAEDDGHPVGFVIAGAPRDEDMAADPDIDLELQALYVLATHWDTGLGHRLMTEAVGDRSAYLWVLEINPRARRFYERHGFLPDGTGRDDPEGREVRLVRR